MIEPVRTTQPSPTTRRLGLLRRLVPVLLLVAALPLSILVPSGTPLALAGVSAAPTDAVGYWPFDEASGTQALDPSGGLSGTLSNASRVAGRVGNGAVALTGTDSSFVSFPASVGTFGTQDFTVAFWLKTQETTLPLFDVIGNRSAGSHGNFFQLRMTGTHAIGNGRIVAEIDQDGAGANFASVTSGPGYNDGQWHHIAVTRLGTTLTLYVDGAATGSSASAGVTNIGNGNPFKIGRSLAASAYAGTFTPNASFDDLAVYDRALAASEIQGIHAAALTSISHPPSQLAFRMQPGVARTGIVWEQQPVVAILDANGQPVSDATAEVTLSITGGTPLDGVPGTLTCDAATVAASLGRASFGGCRIDSIGNGYRLTATAPGLAPAVSGGFTVGAPMPSISGFTRVGATEGDPSFLLGITGAGFVPRSVVRWGDRTLPTTFVDGGRLNATVPVDELYTAGAFDVTVMTAAPGGGTSAARGFVIQAANLSGGGALRIDGGQPNQALPTCTFVCATNVAFGVMTSTDNLAMESWVRWDGPTESDQVIMYNGDSSFYGYGLLVTSPGGRLAILLGGVRFIISDAALTPGVWQHVAMVRQGGLWNLYLDGVSQPLGVTSAPNGFPGLSILHVGSNERGGATFAGSIDEVRIWTTARSAAEIAAGRGTRILNGAAGLAAHWRLDDGTGNTAGDASGRARTLLLLLPGRAWASSGVGLYNLRVNSDRDIATSQFRDVEDCSFLSCQTERVIDTYPPGDRAAGDGVCSTGRVLGNGEIECTLRAAIDEANATSAGGVSILVPAGNHLWIDAGGVRSEAEYNTRAVISRSMTITGAAINQTTLGGYSARHFRVTGGATLQLQRIALMHGNSRAEAGAILIEPGTNAVLSDVLIAENRSRPQGYEAGGIRNQGGLIARNTRFFKNVASSSGGGLLNEGIATLDAVEFEENSADEGGAVHNAGALRINKGAFARNLGVHGTGLVNASGTSTLFRTTFSDNIGNNYPPARVVGGSIVVLPFAGDTPAPAPSLGALGPATAPAGAAGLTLTLTGTGFQPGSIARWNGADRPTTFISAAELRAELGGADLATPGPGSLTVFTAAPGGGTSLAAVFTVQARTHVLGSLNPPVAVAGTNGLSISVSGSGFQPGAIVRWAGSDRPTTFVSATLLTATLTAADLVAAVTPATRLVTVALPVVGTGTSGSLVFTLIGVSTSSAQSTSIQPGGTASVSTAPSTTAAGALGGVTASLTNAGGGAGGTTVTAATYSGNPTGLQLFNAGGAFVDLQVGGATAATRMTSFFYYPTTTTGAAETALTLQFFNGTAWVPVRSSGGTSLVKNTADNLDGTLSGGRFTVTFDATSTPRIDQLTGTVIATVVDATPPTLTPRVTGQLGQNGWYNGDVLVEWLAEDAESGVTLGPTCATTTVVDDTGPDGVTLSCTVESPGGTQSDNVTVRSDATAPVIAVGATAGGFPYTPGAWANAPVVVAFTCIDGGSGLAGACPAGQTLAAEGDGQATDAGQLCDQAGNCAPARLEGIRIDLTAPTIAPPASLRVAATGRAGADVAYDPPTGADALSGPVGGPSCAQPTGTTFALGDTLVACVLSDQAGNRVSAAFTVTVYDPTPPTLTPIVAGTPGLNGWYRSDVTVSWQIGDAESQVSSVAASCAPTTLTADTTGLAVACSVTSAGGTTTRVITVRIDRTAPELVHQFDPASKIVQLFGRDGGSGVSPGPLTPTSVTPTRWGKDEDDADDDEDDDRGRKDRSDNAELRTYRVADAAGNTLTLVEKVKLAKNQLKIKVVSLQYNGGPVITQPANVARWKWSVDKDGALKDLSQRIALGKGRDREVVTVRHDKKESVSGIVLLRLATSAGALVVER